MIPQKILYLIIASVLLTTMASATPISLNDYIGTYNIHFNTDLPFNSAMVLDPTNHLCYAVIISEDSITVSRDLINPDVYLFPTENAIIDVHDIISDGKVTFQERLSLAWTWWTMEKYNI